MSLSLIVAISENNCIGQAGGLPWHLPGDLKHFKALTTGKIVLMGRKTWESLPEKFRPLPERKNIVISRQPNYIVPAGVEVYQTIDEARAAHPHQEIVVIGGATIYEQTLPLAQTLHITEVKRHVDGDAFFPVIDKKIWREVSREDHPEFSFVTYTRV